MPRQLRVRKRVGKECMTVPTCWTKEKSQNTVLCAGTDQDVYLNDCANTTVRFSTFGELENVDLPDAAGAELGSEPVESDCASVRGDKQLRQSEPPH